MPIKAGGAGGADGGGGAGEVGGVVGAGGVGVVSAHRLVTWDRSQSVVGRHHRKRCDIFCVTVTHCDVESVI